MWGWLLWMIAAPALVCLLLLLAAAGVKLWPAKPEVWRMDCEDCEWGGTISGPTVTERLAAMIAGTHWEKTAHNVQLTEEKGR